MNFFKKIFDKLNQKEGDDYKIPSSSDPLNSADPVYKFAQLFSLSGGYYNYCTNEKDMLGVLLEAIKIEKIQHFFCIDDNLKNFLDYVQVSHSEVVTPSTEAAFITCEHLITYDGKIMLSTENIGHYLPSNLPNIIIIVSQTSQIQENLSTAMSVIKLKKNISNITSISGHKSGISFSNKIPQKIILITLEDEN